MSWPRIEYLLLLLLAGCTEAGGGKCQIAHVTDLPLTFRDGNIMTPATLNGVATNMILDTGAELTVVSRATAERIGLNLQYTGVNLNGIGGSRSIYLTFTRDFEIGGLFGKRLPLAVSEMVLGDEKQPADGLFGADFLSAYEVDLDLPEHKAKLFKLVSSCPTPAAALDEPLYLAQLKRADNPDDDTLHVIVQIDGVSLNAVIDSSASSTVIFRNAARRLGLRLEDLTADLHVKGRGIGPYARDEVKHIMAPIKIGEITISHLPVSIIDQRSDDATDMLLGLDFLSHVHVWLSFKSHMMLMQYPPKPSPASPD